MNTKHTPGPWKWDGQLSLFNIECSGGHIIDSARYEGSWLSRYNPAEDEANARLIAAAPELLEALLDVMDAISCLPCSLEDFAPSAAAKVDAAIAKATGEGQP